MQIETVNTYRKPRGFPAARSTIREGPGEIISGILQSVSYEKSVTKHGFRISEIYHGIGNRKSGACYSLARDWINCTCSVSSNIKQNRYKHR